MHSSLCYLLSSRQRRFACEVNLDEIESMQRKVSAGGLDVLNQQPRTIPDAAESVKQMWERVHELATNWRASAQTVRRAGDADWCMRK